MRKLKENSIAKKILLQIGESCKGLFEASFEILFDFPNLVKGFSLYKDYSLYPYRYTKGINQLKRNGYLKQKQNKFYLTPKGRIEIIRTIIKNKRNKKLKWDRKWRIIIFDIPELNRKERKFLRNELRWMGFKELQKSVWIFPYDIEKELLALLKLWKMDFKGDIRFLRVEKIVEEKDLREHFGLKEFSLFRSDRSL